LKKLLLLHGALGASSQFASLGEKLRANFDIHTLDFRGHGGLDLPSEPFSIKLFSKDVLNYLGSNNLDSINIFGYSMGGYVAIYLARHFTSRIGKIFTLGTKFKWDEDTASKEIRMIDPAKIKEKVPQFYDELVKRHNGRSVDLILKKTAEMMVNLGSSSELKRDDYGVIQNHITIGIGDKDKMVTMEESVDVYSRLPNGRLSVLEDTPHQLEGVDADMLAGEIRDFF